MTTPATQAPQLSFLEKVGGEALDLVVAYGEANEDKLLGLADAELKAGAGSAEVAVSVALKKDVPLVGGTIGAEVDADIAKLEPVAEGDLKAAFDKFLAAVKAKAVALGG
jgi:hypothetical protein